MEPSVQIVRPARESDSESIRHILDELDLYHHSLSMKNFWIILDDDSVTGVAHLENFDLNAYLSAVGVIEKMRRRGIATTLLREALSDTGRDVYIYTIIPEFFGTLGFVPAKPSAGIPSRGIYDCRTTCSPDRCICMVLEEK